MLTKKHFLATADIIKDLKSVSPKIKYNLAAEFCAYFFAENPLFDEERFLKACGVTKEVKAKSKKK